MINFVLSFLLISFTMTAIIFTLLLINRLFGKAFPAKYRYAIWLVALIGVIIPLRPVIGNGFLTVPLPAQILTPDIEGAEILLVTDTGMTAADTTGGSIFRLFSSPLMVGVQIWAVISLALFARHIWRYTRFKNTIKRWGETTQDEKILSVFQTVQSEMGLSKKSIDLKICGFITSSMLTGFLRPVILLPKKDYEIDELEFIFRHEFIHYKRRDMYIKLLSVIAVSIHWLNPIIYRMSTALQTDGEASCDEAVLVNADKSDRHFYAEVILGMAGEKNTPLTTLSTCFYGGKSGMKKRLDSIMDTSHKRKRIAVFMLVGVMAMTMLSGSVLAFAVQEVSDLINVRITSEQAKGIALTTVGGGSMSENSYDDSLGVYRVVVLYGDKRYSMDIKADDGLVANYRLESIEILVPDTSSNITTSNEELTIDQAAEAALTIVGGGIIEEIRFVREGETLIYRIKGRFERKEYDMRIGAATGEVISFKEENKSSYAPSYSAQITFGEAMAIALEKVGGGVVNYVEFERDDGTWIYEVTLRHNGQKYEIYIHADTGEITRIK